MRSKVSSDQLLFDPEIERTARRLNSKARKRANIVKARDNATATSSQQLETIDESQEGLFFHELFTEEEPEVFIQPTVVNMAANGPCANSPRLNPQFARTAANGRPTELKTGIIQLICASPFAGLDHEDPYTHLTRFYELAGTTGVAQADEEALFKRLFPHSLLSKAKDWYLDQPEAVMTNWNTLEEKFLERFYSQNRFFEAKTAIAVFSQGSNESLNEAWERYKAMLRKCKGHGFTDVDQIHMFRNGLTATNKTLLDATAGGSLMSKTPEEATQIIERMALNDRQGNHDRTVRDKKPEMLELNNSDALLAQNKLLTSQVEILTQQMSKLPQQLKALNGISNSYQVAKCELCKGNHQTGFCPPVLEEEVNYMNNTQGPRQNQYQNQPYQQGHPPRHNNQGYQQRPPNQGYQQQAFQPYTQPPQQQQGGQSKLEETVNQFIQTSIINQKNQEAAIKSLETQVDQLAKQIATHQSNATFSANTQENPREHCKAVVTRSGQKCGKDETETNEVEDDKEKEDEKHDGEDEEYEIINKGAEEEDMSREVKKEKLKRRSAKDKMANNTIPSQHLPYPHAPSKKDNARQYARFMEIFKQLQINIPFSEAIAQMSKYAKFMKDILTKKKRMEEEEVIILDAQCSAIISRLPQKARDPGRVTLPVTIGNQNIGNGLIDLGSSINLIPLSIVKRLGNIEMKSTRMTLQLADKYTTLPYGIAQDMLVKVDKFLFPVDFVVIDMEEDKDSPIILGRPFMKTARMMIDIDDGIMKLRVQDEEVCFNLFDAMKQPKDKNDCFRMDVTEASVEEVASQIHLSNPLERSLVDSFNVLTQEEEKEIELFLKELEKGGNTSNKEDKVEDLGLKKEVKESKLELKLLPTHLKYVFLDEEGSKPVIISSKLNATKEARLIQILQKNKAAIGWVLADLKGISPAYCMHTIMLEEDFKPVAQPQRRLNPTMKEIVRKEVIKLLEAGMIYPISDSEWVSPVQVVPKKGGMTVIRNEKNELIPTRTVTGWRMCIDYRRLNQATRKDHFPLPFMDQMLERLAGKNFCCFLDGYSGYNQITVNPEDQEKTAFSCPFGIFAYMRMPFGLCNAPATFQRCMQAIFSDFIEKSIEVFMDDFSVYGSSFDLCLKNLDEVMERCIETNLVLNWEKCTFMVTDGIALGHKVSS